MSPGDRTGVAFLRRAPTTIERPPGERASPRAAHLRRAVAAIEAGRLEPGSFEPDSRPAPRLKLARAFDPALGGGLAGDGLHEMVPSAPADAAAALAFALALAARFLARRSSSALIIGEPFGAFESGALYGPGLVGHGLPLSRLVFVSAPDPLAALWAMEEALKCGAAAAVVGELWTLKPYGLAASRRLLLAARKGRTPALLVLAGAAGRGASLSTAAETRFEIAAAPSRRSPAAAGRDLPGAFACSARLMKARQAFARDGPAEAFDRDRVVRLEWRSEEGTFDDPAISLALAAAPADGPRAAAQHD